MNEPLTVSFSEFAYYDIDADAEVVKLMGTTGRGTYELEVLAKSAGYLRAWRNKFKEQVVDWMEKGVMPWEAVWPELEDENAQAL